MKTILTGIFLTFTLFALAQVSAHWGKNPVLVGEHNSLTLTLTSQNSTQKIQYQPKSGSFSCEIKQKNETLWKQGGELEILAVQDSTFTEKKKNITTFVYKTIAWDTAMYRVPNQQVTIGDSTYFMEIPPLAVVFTKKKIDPSIFEIPIHAESEWWMWLKKYWWIFALAILALTLLIRWNIRKKANRIATMSLRERTLLALSQLKKKEDWKHGKLILHYSSFSSIVKMYLGSHFELNLMERTTQETSLLLKQKLKDENSIKRILNLLLEADMVKFAKTTPSDDQVKKSMQEFEHIVNELSPLELPNE